MRRLLRTLTAVGVFLETTILVVLVPMLAMAVSSVPLNGNAYYGDIDVLHHDQHLLNVAALLAATAGVLLPGSLVRRPWIGWSLGLVGSTVFGVSAVLVASVWTSGTAWTWVGAVVAVGYLPGLMVPLLRSVVPPDPSRPPVAQFAL